MLVRKIEGAELKRCAELCSLCFDYDLKEKQLTPEAYLTRVQEQPHSAQDRHWDSQWAAFTDQGQMMSTFTVVPYTVHFDGHEVAMGGIGGVATLPAFRGMGGVRGCFTAALPDMHRRGMALSYLYPFSTAFYGKFGYAPAVDWVQWQLALAPLKGLKHPESRLVEDESLLPAIRELDFRFARQFNLMVLTEDIDRGWVKEESPFSGRRWTHVVYSDQHRPLGYVTCETLKEGGERLLNCSRFVFDGLAGLRALLGHLNSYAADYSALRCTLPDSVHPDSLLSEWSFGYVQRTVRQGGMVRAINAEQLLRLCRARGEGRVRVQLSDPFIPANNGCFQVDMHPGSENTVTRVEAPGDIRLDIAAFSQLITGVRALEPAWQPHITVEGQLENLHRLFCVKPCFINTPF